MRELTLSGTLTEMLKAAVFDKQLPKSVLNNFPKFTGENNCSRVFLLKRRLWQGCFPATLVNFFTE